MGIPLGIVEELRLNQLAPDGRKIGTAVFRYRMPTTQQRNEYLAKSTRLFRLAQSKEPSEAEKAMDQLLQLRTDYALQIFVDADGFDIPEGSTLKDAIAEYAGQYLQKLAEAVFELDFVQISKDPDIDLPGKSVPRSNSSRAVGSVRSRRPAASG